MVCNEDLKKEGMAYPRTCAECGNGHCTKYAVTQRADTAYVLWHMHGDGSGAHVERVYLDAIRADQDFKLLSKQPDGSEWKLDPVPIFGDRK